MPETQKILNASSKCIELATKSTKVTKKTQGTNSSRLIFVTFVPLWLVFQFCGSAGAFDV